MATIIRSSHDTIVGDPADVARAIVGSLTYLDRGLFKAVYVDDTRSTVYKLVKPDMTAGVSSSRLLCAAKVQLEAESDIAIDLRQQGIRGIPPVTLYEHANVRVLAMPYYDGTCRDRSLKAEYLADWYDAGLTDLHDGNYTYDVSGNPVVIDLAGWADGHVDGEQWSGSVEGTAWSDDDDDAHICRDCDTDIGSDTYAGSMRCTTCHADWHTSEQAKPSHHFTDPCHTRCHWRAGIGRAPVHGHTHRRHGTNEFGMRCAHGPAPRPATLSLTARIARIPEVVPGQCILFPEARFLRAEDRFDYTIDRAMPVRDGSIPRPLFYFRKGI